MDTGVGVTGRVAAGLQERPTLLNTCQEAMPLRWVTVYTAHLEPSTWAALTQTAEWDL